MSLDEMRREVYRKFERLRKNPLRDEFRLGRLKLGLCEVLVGSIWGWYGVFTLSQWAGPMLNFYDKGPEEDGFREVETSIIGRDITCTGVERRYIKSWGLLLRVGSKRLGISPERCAGPEYCIPTKFEELPLELSPRMIERHLLSDLNSSKRKREILQGLANDVYLKEMGVRITDYEVLDVFLTNLREDASEATLNIEFRVWATTR